MPPVTIEELYRDACAHLSAGRLAQAEAACKAIFAREPRHPDALHVLGVVATNAMQPAAAIQLIQAAIAIRPDAAEYHNNLGNAFRSAGRLDEAIASFSRAASLRVDFAEALRNLGITLRAAGRVAEAVDEFRRALKARPGYGEVHANLGVALQQLGRINEAIASFERAVAFKPGGAMGWFQLGDALSDAARFTEAVAAFGKALKIKPDFVEALSGMGVAQKNLGRIDEAIAALERAATLAPERAEVHANLGNAYREARRFDSAIAASSRAVTIKPELAIAWSNLGNCLSYRGRHAEAIEACKRAVLVDPGFVRGYNNLGTTFLDAGNVPAAVECFQRAITLQPDMADAHNNLGIGLLLLGNWEAGWREYAWRLKTSYGLAQEQKFSMPEWDGSELTGRTILIYAEQGAGDTLQFVRYLALVKKRGGRVVFECPRPLVQLLHGLEGVDQMVIKGEARPAFDLRCALLSLPRIFATTPESVPGPAPYLRASPEKIAEVNAILPPRTGMRRIGLAWAGNKGHDNDHNRSIPPGLLAPFAQIGGVEWVSLQKGESALETPSPLAEARWIDVTPRLTDYADTAALMANLDLVISVDTSVAHLAGALGVPVWTLLPFAPDWRWMLQREDTPWYPTMRLLRQQKPGDWKGVLSRVVDELSTGI